MRACLSPHHYIERQTARVCEERLFADRLVNLLYTPLRERAPVLFRALTSARVSRLLGLLNYGRLQGKDLAGARRLIHTLGIDLCECLGGAAALDSPRAVFERRIRYWDTRPMPADPAAVVAPADARMLVGAFGDQTRLFIKEKFFDCDELLGVRRPDWREHFQDGQFALFRLTPEKYHYNHSPVAGRVVDHYALDGCYHACNPGAVVAAVTPFSKNKRVVTVIDTDLPGGTRAGHVAMIEVVALMIGDIVQCYSDSRYDAPRPVRPGDFLQRGQPKSLYRPGSSVDVLIFEQGRVRFSEDIVANMFRRDAVSRYSKGFGQPLVETEVAVRAAIGAALPDPGADLEPI
ncbi:MAG TPA: phosphatidylserine decarboxylase [Desulfobacterales bacterium]|nr:phosphatidylserine decarboxylase [Desulfobacterales bacterium]